MANNRLLMSGLDELRAALRQLPETLKEEAREIVRDAAEDARIAVDAGYAKHVVTGSMRGGLKKTDITKGLVPGALLTNTDPEANIFEHGSQIRKTRTGTSNPLPPGRIFIPIVVRTRRDMNGKLINLVRRQGFEVSDAGLL